MSAPPSRRSSVRVVRASSPISTPISTSTGARTRSLRSSSWPEPSWAKRTARPGWSCPASERGIIVAVPRKRHGPRSATNSTRPSAVPARWRSSGTTSAVSSRRRSSAPTTRARTRLSSMTSVTGAPGAGRSGASSPATRRGTILTAMVDPSAVGLPGPIAACLFDLDGVLTDTARIHAEAWKQMFDAFLAKREGQRPFDPHEDYDRYVDGRPRYDGVAEFVRSRGIELSDEEIHRLGDQKNDIVLKLIHERGIDPYPGSVRYVRAVREAGLRTAVVSSSANTRDVLHVAGIEDLFDARVDGVTIEEEHLHGKPAPDSFLAGARAIGVEPAQATVFEDALAGVEAGRAGHFGYVVGVDRAGQADALREHGADVVVTDLAELLP